MEYLIVTYHMSKPGELAESCIRLPMTPERAAIMLADGHSAVIDAILNLLAELQGYEGATYCCCCERTSLQ